MLLVAVGVLAAMLLLGNRNDIPVPTPSPEVIVLTTNEPPPADVVLTGAQIFENSRFAVFRVASDFGYGLEPIGSGFFICSSGIAVTNHHVMSAYGGLTNASVILFDDSVFEITGYYSYDIGNDIAIIKVESRGKVFDFLTIEDSDNVRVGDDVYAIGGPEGDPLTFTSGMVSRIAYEPISIDIYTVAGLLQHEAAIYGGNSGGPLVNNKGHVIGINTFGHMLRASVQWAVPINRVIMPAPDATVYPLPVSIQTPSQVHVPGQVFGYDSFPTVPNFISVSRNASFITGGNANEFDFDLDGIYSRLYAYSLAARYSMSDIDAYGVILVERGFYWQGDFVDIDGDLWEYYYDTRNNISVSYCYAHELEMVIILIGTGDAYKQLHGSSDIGLPPPSVPGYVNFPLVPDVGLLIPSAELIDSRYFYEWGLESFTLGGNLYVVKDDYIYLYKLPLSHIEDSEIFYVFLLENGFEVIRENFYDEDGDQYFAALFRHPSANLMVSSIYLYESEEWLIAIG